MISVKSKSFKTELYRKAIHLSSLWMPLCILFVQRNVCILLFAGLFLINLFVEYTAFYKSTALGIIFRKTFIKTLRNKEVCHSSFVPSGSVYILAAALVVSVCFSAQSAAVSMFIVLIADSNAALFGKFFGTFRFYNGKSVEGTLAFFMSTLSILFFFFPDMSPAFLGVISMVATAAEFFEKELGLDDNFAIPFITGFILNLITF